MTKFLVKTENTEKAAVYFEVDYVSDHYNNYIDATISEHPLTQKYVNMGYSIPVVIASYDNPISEELLKIEKMLPQAKKNLKGFPMYYYDLIKKKTQLTVAYELIKSDSFVEV